MLGSEFLFLYVILNSIRFSSSNTSQGLILSLPIKNGAVSLKNGTFLVLHTSFVWFCRLGLSTTSLHISVLSKANIIHHYPDKLNTFIPKIAE